MIPLNINACIYKSAFPHFYKGCKVLLELATVVISASSLSTKDADMAVVATSTMINGKAIMD
jgi:hypothetical protein